MPDKDGKFKPIRVPSVPWHQPKPDENKPAPKKDKK